MLSRIMRHPAGLMRKALSRKFLAGAFRQLGPAAAPPPAYWLNRFSNPGLILIVPPAPVPGAGANARVPVAAAAAGLLPAQGGKASSFLGAGPAERVGARPPRP